MSTPYMLDRISINSNKSNKNNTDTDIIGELGKITFGIGIPFGASLGLDHHGSLNDEAKAYLSQINELKETVKILKNEKFELYEEKTAEIRELKSQLNLGRYSMNSLQSSQEIKNERNEALLVEKKKNAELKLSLKNKQVCSL